MRRIWQYLRSDFLSSGLGRERFCRRLVDTVSGIIEAGHFVRNEFAENVPIDPTDISDFGLNKFINSAPPLKRTKILLLAHLYCQRTFKDVSFVDGEERFVAQRARALIEHTLDLFPRRDLVLANRIAEQFSGNVCIHDDGSKSIRVGNFRPVSEVHGCVFGHTHAWRTGYPVLGDLIRNRFDYPKNGNVFRIGITSRDRKMGITWKERKSIDKETGFVMFFPYYVAGYRETTRDARLLDLSVVHCAKLATANEIPVVALRYDVDFFTGDCQPRSVDNLLFDQTTGTVLKTINRIPNGGLGVDASVPPPDLRSDLETAQPAYDDPMGLVFPRYWRMIPNDCEAISNIFDLYGWSMR
ncbi:hypothetical protein PB2503_05802 [Parvularcula bermudensis HTCC2503]|uniref:Uncharacterized protein n=2 Tax=Parvularcula TaxID=208215 RepID=E0TGZ1_PARBH|nr:hypothetical protein PB2503_05802 [Parvularcula bermudensis HTCC2503]